MGVLKIVLTVVFILASIALTVIVLMQEGKSAGLGAISGMAETYWGKNKGRSIEGKLEKITRFLAIGFLVLAVVLNFNFDRTSAADSSGSDADQVINITAAPDDADASAEETESSDDTQTEAPGDTETPETESAGTEE